MTGLNRDLLQENFLILYKHKRQLPIRDNEFFRRVISKVIHLSIPDRLLVPVKKFPKNGLKKYFFKRFTYSIMAVKPFRRTIFCKTFTNLKSNVKYIISQGFIARLPFKSIFSLTLKDPFISESFIEIKVELNFYFHTSLWCLKMFYPLRPS